MNFIKRINTAIVSMEKHIGFASSLLLVLMIFGKIAGFLKLHFIARFFGISQELDIFWAAFALPDLIFALLVVGTVNAALIPIFIKIHKNEDKKTLVETLNTVIVIQIVLLIIFSVVIYFLTPYMAHLLFRGQDILGVIKLDPALSDKSSEYYYNLYINLSRMMLASPFILSISSVLSAYLQSHKRFMSSALAPVFYNIGMLGGIFFFVTFAPQFGIYALGYSVLIGSLLHLIVQLPSVIMLHMPSARIFSFNRYVKEIILLSVPRIFGLGVEQIAIIFNTFWSFTLGAGALSVFKFASSLHLLPVDILSGSFLQAIFPHLNEAAHKRDNNKSLNQMYLRALLLIIFVGIPLVVFMIVLRMPLIRLVYGAGRFSWTATVATSFMMVFFAPAILLQAIASLNIRTFYSLHSTKTSFFVSLAGVISSLSLSILFTNFFSHYYQFSVLLNTFLQAPTAFDWSQLLQVFSWFLTRNQAFAAVAGLALGLTIAMGIEVIMSAILLSRKTKFISYMMKEERHYWDKFRQLTFSGFIMLFTAYLTYKLFDRFFDTSFTINLIIVSSAVTLISGGIYIFLTKNVWTSLINREKFLRGISRFLPKSIKERLIPVPAQEAQSL